jgi:hypothetical protein
LLASTFRVLLGDELGDGDTVLVFHGRLLVVGLKAM